MRIPFNLTEILSKASHLESILAMLARILGPFGSGSGEKVEPAKVHEKVRGMLGLLGKGDERAMLMNLVALHNADPEAYRTVLEYFAWELNEAKKLRGKLGSIAVYLMKALHANRIRVILAGMPRSEGKEIKTTTRKAKKHAGVKGKGRPVLDRETVTRKYGEGSNAAVDFMLLLAHTMSVEDYRLRALDRVPSDNVIRRKTYEHVRNWLSGVPGLPRVPRPDEVPDLMAFYRWIERNGGELGRGIVSAASAGGEWIADQCVGVRDEIDAGYELHVKQQQSRSGPRRLLDLLLS